MPLHHLTHRIAWGAVAVAVASGPLGAQTDDRSLEELTAFIAETTAFEGSAQFGQETIQRFEVSGEGCVLSMQAELFEDGDAVTGTISFNAGNLFADLIEVDDDDVAAERIEIELPMQLDAADPTVEFFAPVGTRTYEQVFVEVQANPDMGSCDERGCTISTTLPDRTLPLLTPEAYAAGDDVVAALRQMNTLCMDDAVGAAPSE